MGKTVEEITSDILTTALSAGQIKTQASGTTGQASEIGSAYKQIYLAVANPPPPPPAPPLVRKKKEKKAKKSK